jgi:hypothetical protein
MPCSFDCGGDIYRLVLSTLTKAGITGQGQQELQRDRISFGHDGTSAVDNPSGRALTSICFFDML